MVSASCLNIFESIFKAMNQTTERAALLGRLEEIYRRDSKQYKIVFFLMMLFFGGGLLGALVSEKKMEPWMYFILLAFLGCFLMFARAIRRSNPYNIEAIHQIRAGNIVWIYPENTNTRYGTSFNVKVKSADGRFYTIPTAQYQLQEEMVERLANNFPDAALGYDEETKKQMQQKFRK